MAKDLFYSLDLNLLRTFLVLSQELNMKKASRRLFVSQPAISQALQKLRHHFNDELFVKVPKGLEATQFANELAAAITPHLDGLAIAVNSSYEFNPANIDQTIKIALSPMVLSCLSGSLFQRLREQSPNADIQLVSWTHNTHQEISKGETLIGVNYDLQASKDIYLNKLLDITGKVLVRQGHPLKKNLAEVRDFADYEIASFINPGWNDHTSFGAEVLKRQGFSPKIGFRSEMISALIDVVLHTDMIMPHSNLFPVEQYPNLRAIDVDLELNEKIMSVYSHYHLKNRNNPLLQWLHQQILHCLRNQIHLSNTLIHKPES